MPTYKLVSFDVDDTLLDFQTMQRQGMATVAEAMHTLLGGDHAHLTTDYLIERYRQQAATHDPIVAPWRVVRRGVFATILAESGRTDAEAQADALIAAYLRTFAATLDFLPGARELLAALRGRVALGWVTNGNTTPQDAGVADLFGVVITPDQHRLKKPDRAVFEEAARQAGCTLAEILHVGDSLNSDVAGAQAAGCRGVWYNPAGRINDSGIVPGVEVAHLSEVLALLD